MTNMTLKQQAVLDRAVSALAVIDGVRAVVLGGSFARGRARPDSDIDIGIYYRDSAPFSIHSVRQIAASLNDTPDPVVTGFMEWGPWVNGGAWLVVDGQRVDFLYRSLDQWDDVFDCAGKGEYQLDYGQQPPFGFFSTIYLGEMRIAVPMFDEMSEIATRKHQVVVYPEELRRSIIQNCLWGVEFGLGSFAPKFANAGDTYGVVGCLARFSYFLVLALFALNRQYPVNDKTSLDEIASFDSVPPEFVDRLKGLLSCVGTQADELHQAIEGFRTLFEEVVAASAGLYRPRRSP